MLVVQERNGSNVPQVHYTRGADLSGSLSGAGGIGGLLLRSSGYSAGSWGAQNAYHGDGNGNVTALVDGSGTLQAVYKYDPFGNTIASTGSLAAANTMRFSSKPVILTTGGNFGAVYYGYRFYDPANQRWQNRDPIEEKGGIIHYGFVGNSPTIFVDILGLDYSGGLTPIWPEKGEGAFGCGWRIKNEVWEQYGKNRPPSDPSARVAHCIAHCRIKRECTGGGATSWLGGFAKEVQDWAKKVTGGGGDGYDQGDMDANAKGRKCAKNMEKNCEGQCGDAMRSGELY
jgi:RHS repeat-associated protein